VVEALAIMTHLCKERIPEAKHAEDKLITVANNLGKLANELESFRTRRHDPYEGLLITMNKSTSAEIKGVSVPCLEWISDNLPKLFEKVKDAESKRVIEALGPQTISALAETFRENVALYKRLPSLELKTPPPCIKPDILESLRNLRLTTLKGLDNKCEEAYREYVKHKETLLAHLVRVIASIFGVDESEVDDLIKSFLDKRFTNICHYIPFTYYLISFNILLGPCLHWYEQGGRYPSLKVGKQAFSVREKQGKSVETWRTWGSSWKK